MKGKNFWRKDFKENSAQPLDKLGDELAFKWGRVVTTQVMIHHRLSFWSPVFLSHGIP
jgi:hypothetical protein